MCYQLVYIVFDFAAESTLKDSAAMNRCAAQIAARIGWSIEGESEPDAAWSSALKKGGRSVYVNFSADPDSYGLTVSVITNQWRRLYLSAYRAGMQNADYRKTLLTAAESIYETLAPDYGYGLISLDTQYLEPPAEGDYRPKTVHDYNFFSPRLTAKFSSLSAVPAVRLVPFSDGGTLLELSPDPLGDRKAYAANYIAASGILSIPNVQQGC